MKTPFTTEQFLNVFEKYNATVFPFQWVMLLLAVILLFVFHYTFSLKDKIIGSFLGLLWIWMGLVYHIIFFTEINKLAFVFGGFFILEGILVLINIFSKDKLIFNFSFKIKDYAAYFFILFGLIIYPIIGYFIQGSFNRTIALGLPYPSTIFTFGFFMMTGNKFPKYLMIIPSIWAMVGLFAAIQFGVYQDVMLPIAGIFAATVLIKQKRNHLCKIAIISN